MIDSTDIGVVIYAMGDIMLGDSSIKIGHGVRSSLGKADIHRLFSDIRPLFENKDIIFGNLEVVLSDAGLEKSILSRSYRGSPNAVKALKNAGFTVMNIANNHINQHGLEAFRETISLLKKNDIHPVGIKGKQEKSEPVELFIKGKKIGIFGFSLQPEVFSINPPYAHGNLKMISESIETYQQDFDYLILSLHWGAEHINYPSPVQIKMARTFIDLGANLILGHHSHAVQGIERYGKGLICYNLGNFVFDKHQKSFRQTYILKILLSEDRLEHKILPVIISKRFRPIPMNARRAKEFRQYIQNRSMELEREDISSLEIKQRRYETEAEQIRMVYRKSLKYYFMRNFYRYSLRDAFLTIRNSMKKSDGDMK